MLKSEILIFHLLSLFNYKAADDRIRKENGKGKLCGQVESLHQQLGKHRNTERKREKEGNRQTET